VENGFELFDLILRRKWQRWQTGRSLLMLESKKSTVGKMTVVFIE